MRFIRREILEVTLTDSRGGPHHVCSMPLYSVRHLVSYILDQLWVCLGNMIVMSISVMQENMLYIRMYPCNGGTSTEITVSKIIKNT